jgi:predicted O-methyltransferase YrrM
LIVGASREVGKRVRRGELDGRVSALEFAFSFDYGNLRIEPLQIRSEIDELLQLFDADPPRTILEVGTARGGTLFLFAAVAAPDAFLLTIDFPEGDPSFGGSPEYKRRTRLFSSFARPHQRIEFMAADSHDEETFTAVTKQLDGRPVDLLFIDGDHTLEGVRRDFDLYSSLVRDAGIIAFHDIVPGPPESVGGVPEFWREKKDEHARELVADWGQQGFGIGVLTARRHTADRQT